MAWPQIYCPKCGKHMGHKAKIKEVGTAGAVYRCPQCKHEFGVSRRGYK